MNLGMTALAIAAEDGNQHLAAVLLRHKADTEIVDDFGRSPLILQV